jgi:virginiamycin B lyase
MWFTAGSRLGRIDAHDSITSFPLPNPSAAAEDLATDSNGAVWFIEKVPTQVGDATNRYSNVVGRMDASGAVTEYPVGTESDGLPWPPSTIVRGPDGAMWFTEGTAKAVGRIDLAGQVTNFALPGFCSGVCQPGSITAGNGALWFANTFGGRVGRLTPSGQLRSFRVRGTSSGTPVRAITMGPDRAIWFASNAIVGRRTASGRVSRWVLDGSQGGAIATRITSGPSRTVWVATYTTLYRVPVNLPKRSRTPGSGGGGRR